MHHRVHGMAGEGTQAGKVVFLEEDTELGHCANEAAHVGRSRGVAGARASG